VHDPVGRHPDRRLRRHFGPHLLSTFVQKTSLKDTRGPPSPDEWNSRGDFNLAGGTGIDPDTEVVELTFNQTSSTLYQAALVPPGKFVQKGNPSGPSWKFVDRTATTPLALGWKKAAFKQKFNKVKFSVQGFGVEVPLDTTPPILLRQSLKIGNECATVVLECAASGTRLKVRAHPAVGLTLGCVRRQPPRRLIPRGNRSPSSGNRTHPGWGRRLEPCFGTAAIGSHGETAGRVQAARFAFSAPADPW
jgi:hypothetical protein